MADIPFSVSQTYINLVRFFLGQSWLALTVTTCTVGVFLEAEWNLCKWLQWKQWICPVFKNAIATEICQWTGLLNWMTVTVVTNKMTGEERAAVTASCSLSLPMVPLRESAVPVQKARCVKVLLTRWRLSAALAPVNGRNCSDLQHRGQLQVQTTGCLSGTAAAENTVKVTPGTQPTTSDPIKPTQSPFLFFSLSAKHWHNPKTPIRWKAVTVSNLESFHWSRHTVQTIPPTQCQ